MPYPIVTIPLHPFVMVKTRLNENTLHSYVMVFQIVYGAVQYRNPWSRRTYPSKRVYLLVELCGNAPGKNLRATKRFYKLPSLNPVSNMIVRQQVTTLFGYHRISKNSFSVIGYLVELKSVALFALTKGHLFESDILGIWMLHRRSFKYTSPSFSTMLVSSCLFSISRIQDTFCQAIFTIASNHAKQPSVANGTVTYISRVLDDTG